jgi:NADPH:quinone reductase-like Zn-dependent oxidoreductase
MKAVQIKSYGDPLEVLEVVDVPDPGAPGANEALLGIEIATLNKHDLLVFSPFECTSFTANLPQFPPDAAGRAARFARCTPCNPLKFASIL